MDQPLSHRRQLTVPVLIFLNIVVFGAWLLAKDGKINPDIVVENFLVSWDGLVEGRYWTLIGSAFSHNLFWHFLLNMLALNSFGPIIEEVLKWKRFLVFYLLACIVSSLSHALVSKFILEEGQLPALGASGAISAILLLFSLLFPREKIMVMGIIPVPAFLGAVAFIGLDIWGLISQARGGGFPIGHGAHLGGALVGILYYLFYVRKRLLKID